MPKEVSWTCTSKPGKAKRYDYAYERHGPCGVLLAFDPQTGWRYGQGRSRRTAVDYAHFMRDLGRVYSPTVERIRLGQENVHTHTPGSFYHIMPPEDALALAQRFALHYTPKKGRWLHMAAIACAALSTQGLDRRIAEQGTFAHAVRAWTHKRNQAHTTVHWKCTKSAAREKLHNKYPRCDN